MLAVKEKKELTVEERIEKELSQIAKDFLKVNTLNTRANENLDFHRLAVWNIKKALEKAYESGRKLGKWEGKN